MNVYRMSSWTHRDLGAQIGFKVARGQHAVMVAIGNIPAGDELTEDKLREMLRRCGLTLKPPAEVWRGGDPGEDRVGVKPE